MNYLFRLESIHFFYLLLGEPLRAAGSGGLLQTQPHVSPHLHVYFWRLIGGWQMTPQVMKLLPGHPNEVWRRTRIIRMHVRLAALFISRHETVK